jgi:hypothetical protein
VADSRLDLLVLRLAVARDQARLRTNVGLEIRVAAAALVELALTDTLVDYEGLPAVVGAGPVALTSLVTRLRELKGWPWEQLLWRQGIDARAGLKRAVAELVGQGTWLRSARPLPLRAARYSDLGGAELRTVGTRLDAVIKGEAEPQGRESVLVALMGLRFLKTDRAEWMEQYWVADADLVALPDRQWRTIQRVIEAADGIAALMRAGGTAVHADSGGGG